MNKPHPATLLASLWGYPDLLHSVLVDCNLSVEEFTQKHAATVRAYHARNNYTTDSADVTAATANFWRYLRAITEPD